MQTDFLIIQNCQEMLSESIKCEEGNQKAVKSTEVTVEEDLSFFSAFIEIADNSNIPLLTKQDMLESPQTGVLKDGIEAGTSDRLPVKDESINSRVKILSDCLGLNFAWIQTDDNEASGFEPAGNSKISDQAIEITAVIGENDELIRADNPLQIVEEIKDKDLKPESRVANSGAVPDKALKPEFRVANSEATPDKALKPESRVANSEAIPDKDLKPESRVANSGAVPDKDLKLESRVANSGAVPDKDLKLESRVANSDAIPDKAMNKGDAVKNDFLQKSGFIYKAADDPAGDINRNVACRLSNPEMKRYHQNIKVGVAKEQSSNTDSVSGRDIKLEADNGKDPFLFSNARSSDNLSAANANLKETQLAQKPFQAEIISQIVKKAVLKIKNGQNEIKIDIKPESLGHIRMQISTENHYVKAMISAENNLAKQIIENNIHLLRAELLNHGLEIDKFEVSVGQDSGQHNSGNEKTEFTGIEQETESVEETEDLLLVGTDGSISYPGQSNEGQQLDLFA